MDRILYAVLLLNSAGAFVYHVICFAIGFITMGRDGYIWPHVLINGLKVVGFFVALVYSAYLFKRPDIHRSELPQATATAVLNLAGVAWFLLGFSLTGDVLYGIYGFVGGQTIVEYTSSIFGLVAPPATVALIGAFMLACRPRLSQVLAGRHD
jgi:hypothetical protein